MKEELLRILRKDGWDQEDLEDLLIIFEGRIADAISKAGPDIAELALKRLVFGRGSLKKRKREASLILGIDEKALDEVFEILKGRKRKREASEKEEELFEDVIEKCCSFTVWNFDEKALQDCKVVAEISTRARQKLSECMESYLFSSLVRKPKSPVVIDGNNFLWKHDLSPSAFGDLFDCLSTLKPFYFPFWVVFDRSAPHIIPASEREVFEQISKSSRVFFHSPADELLISLAREKRAAILSDDKFRDYDTQGLEIIGFERLL